METGRFNGSKNYCGTASATAPGEPNPIFRRFRHFRKLFSGIIRDENVRDVWLSMLVPQRSLHFRREWQTIHISGEPRYSSISTVIYNGQAGEKATS